MLRAKPWIRKASLLLGGLAISGLIVVLYVVPAWRFLSQPTPEEWVEMTAGWLASTPAGTELEGLADELMEEHDQSALELPEAEFSIYGRALPVERLPAKFREKGGRYSEPQLYVRLDANSKPDILTVSWGHLRRSISVYRKPPSKPPRGFAVRRASDRTFVLAEEKAEYVGPPKAGHAKQEE